MNAFAQRKGIRKIDNLWGTIASKINVTPKGVRLSDLMRYTPRTNYEGEWSLFEQVLFKNKKQSSEKKSNECHVYKSVVDDRKLS